MSIDAMNWAWSQRGLTVGQKLVLLSLADRAGENHTCWPSMERICQDTGLTSRGVRKIYIELEARGLLRREHNAGKVTVFALVGVAARENDKPRGELRSGGNTVQGGTEFRGELISGGNYVPQRGELSSGEGGTTFRSPPHPPIKEEPKENPKEPKVSTRGQRKQEPVKASYGEYGNVRLTADEHSRLVERYGEWETAEAIKFLDLHLGAQAKKDPYKSHYLAMQKWVFSAVEEQRRKQGNPRASLQPRPQAKPGDFDPDRQAQIMRNVLARHMAREAQEAQQ